MQANFNKKATTMMTLDEIKNALHADDANIEHVARTTGLSRGTVLRLKKGDSNVLYKSWKLVSDYFEGELESQ